MTDATELDTAAIRARLEAATPGPWVVFDMDDAEKRKDEPLNEPGQGWYWVWSEPRLPYYGAVLEPERDHPAAIGSAAINDSEGGAQEQADAEFIAHARTDVERLLAALDEARAEVERLHSWSGLMELLDEHWPADIFPTLPDDDRRDLGPRIVSLIRMVDQKTRARMAAESALAAANRYLADYANGTRSAIATLGSVSAALATPTTPENGDPA